MEPKSRKGNNHGNKYGDVNKARYGGQIKVHFKISHSTIGILHLRQTF